MFLHGDFWHILFNMFALYMFGSALENFWGPKRFFIYYMATGIGAGIFQILVSYIRLQMIGANIPSDILEKIYTEGFQIIQNNQNYSDPTLAQINAIVNSTTIGASGAVFGLLMAFGIMFPNTMLYVYFAIPIKAKWFVLIYGLIELYSGIRNSANDNVAHFAHLGGMIFGFILIYYWRRKGTYSR
jgi:membrane associated rhomboid family serine protease